MTMKLNPLPRKSRMLKAAGYDLDRRTLAVQFANGTVYEYSDVPPEQFEALVGAESAGQYFGANIRGAFPAKKREKEKTSTNHKDGKEQHGIP